MNSDRSTPKRDYSPGSAQLEPRVAKLELGMERLTDDVRDLAQVVRTQGTQMEAEIQKLVIAVTQAAGPKKTDWGTIIAGIMLVIAIGGAAFWPLNQTSQETKQSLQHLEQRYDEHQNLTLHPVGQALVDRLEQQLKAHQVEDTKGKDALRQCFLDRIALVQKENAMMLDNLKQTVTLNDDRLYSRLDKLEDLNLKSYEKDQEELLMWRQKAMGLTDDNYRHLGTSSGK